MGINNLLMLVAFYFYAASAAKGAKIWLGTKVRHPQLTGFSIWAVAHLLVNGDTRVVHPVRRIAGLGVVEIVLINAPRGLGCAPNARRSRKRSSLSS